MDELENERLINVEKKKQEKEYFTKMLEENHRNEIEKQKAKELEKKEDRKQ